MTIESI